MQGSIVQPLSIMSQLDTIIMNYGNRIFGKKWRIAIVHTLKSGPQRFSQIKNNLPGCSVKVLSESLQEMEENGIVKRKQFQTIPVKVTYELSNHVMQFIDVIENYRLLMVVHLYKYNDRYNLEEEIVSELETILTESSLDVPNLLKGN